MAYFKIPQRVLSDWLWEGRFTSKPMDKIIMENIRNKFNHSEDELGQIERKLKQTFLPHFRRQCSKCRWRKEYMKKKSAIFLNNQFTVKFLNDEK